MIRHSNAVYRAASKICKTSVMTYLCLWIASCGTSLPVVWQLQFVANGPQAIDSSVLATPDVVYVAAYERQPNAPWSEQHYLQALEASSGAVRWRADLGGYRTATPILDSQIVYVFSGGAGLYAIDAVTGHQYWFAPLDADQASPPVVHEQMIYLILLTDGSRGQLVAFDRASGHISWSHPLRRTNWTTARAIVAFDKLYFIDEQTVYQRDLHTGRTINFITSSQPLTAGPLADAQYLYIGTGDTIRAFTLYHGTPAWSVQLQQAPVEILYITDNLLLAASRVNAHPHSSGTGYVAAFDRSTQQTLWEATFKSPIAAIEASQKTVILSSSRSVYGYHQATGYAQWEFSPGKSVHPATLVNEYAYIADWDGKLHALRMP